MSGDSQGSLAHDAHAKAAFLAAPFKAHVDPRTGELAAELRATLTAISDLLESRGFVVYNAHRREAWGREMMSPDECTRLDFEQISSCQHFVALPGCPASPGTHIEIGWASALGKAITLILESGRDYAYLVRGLRTVADVEEIWYDPAGLESIEGVLASLERRLDRVNA